MKELNINRIKLIIELQFYFIWFNELKHSYLHQHSDFKSKYHERKLEKATQPNQTIYIFLENL